MSVSDFLVKTLEKDAPERATLTTPVDFIDGVLLHHNALRAFHNSPPLVIRDDLCKIAQGLANACAAKGRMEHFPEDSIYGQNIHRSSDEPSAKAVVDKWYDEIEKFDWDLCDCQPGTGHFAQVVWKDSTELGVAKAHDAKNGWYTACIYLPVGNIMDEFRENVLPKK